MQDKVYPKRYSVRLPGKPNYVETDKLRKAIRLCHEADRKIHLGHRVFNTELDVLVTFCDDHSDQGKLVEAMPQYTLFADDPEKKLRLCRHCYQLRNRTREVIMPDGSLVLVAEDNAILQYESRLKMSYYLRKKWAYVKTYQHTKYTEYILTL